MDDIGPISEAIRLLAEPELGAEGAGDIELALVEAATNVVRHGYGPEGGPIRIEAATGNHGVRVTIFDWGRPIPGEVLANARLSRFDFDPMDLLEIPEGGMGLSIIATIMDEVTYRSDQGQNILTLLRRVRT
ncbi:anti-sigma B factor, putative [Rubellimicrobium mesophilum DSM 19309]|uniref:Anti-sigma B factor, putative n=1 Tax=Rubellimicrobium mesophilum DSM 19309 TaxID=442562 RepID=A0A017HQD3_9RHOB|nr:anti-sigma B factor, putative [Rubellimicrobium mesophilum DSM 19309]